MDQRLPGFGRDSIVFVNEIRFESVVDVVGLYLLTEEFEGVPCAFIADSVTEDETSLASPSDEFCHDLRADCSPIGFDQFVINAHKRRIESSIAVVMAMTKLTFVTGPLFIDRFVGSAVNSGHFSTSVIKPNRASGAALSANRFAGFEVPRTGSETIFSVGQSADWADFDNVAAELRGEFRFAEGDRLHIGTAETETELSVSRNLFGKAHTTGALDASLKIEGDVIAERECFDRMALHFDEAAGAWTVEKGVILEGTFAASVADWTVQRVVNEQEFKNAPSVFLNCV